MAPAPLLYTTIDSPLGELLLLGDGRALRGLYMQDGRKPATVLPVWERRPDAFVEAHAQLNEYFAGGRRSFELALKPAGSPFQLRIWRALGEIGYGQTVSYGELARRIGRPAAARAVGAANGSNPLAIIVPCHRLVGAKGELTGYAGGLAAKRLLLDLEAGIGRGSLSCLTPNCRPSVRSETRETSAVCGGRVVPLDPVIQTREA